MRKIMQNQRISWSFQYSGDDVNVSLLPLLWLRHRPDMTIVSERDEPTKIRVALDVTIQAQIIPLTIDGRKSLKEDFGHGFSDWTLPMTLVWYQNFPEDKAVMCLETTSMQLRIALWALIIHTMRSLRDGQASPSLIGLILTISSELFSIPDEWGHHHHFIVPMQTRLLEMPFAFAFRLCYAILTSTRKSTTIQVSDVVAKTRLYIGDAPGMLKPAVIQNLTWKRACACANMGFTGHLHI